MPLLRVSHQRQRQPSDCLAACAAMVLAYNGIDYHYSQLLRLLRIQPHGTAFSALNALASLGVEVQIGRGSRSDLERHLDSGTPPILFVNTGMLSYWTSETGHAVLLIGIDAEVAHLHDPALAKPDKAIPYIELEMAWIEQDQLYAILIADMPRRS